MSHSIVSARSTGIVIARREALYAHRRSNLICLPLISTLLCVFASTTLAATPTNFRRADFTTATLQSTLASTVTSLTKAANNRDWIGYSVQPLPNHTICGGNWTNGRIRSRLDDDDDGMTTMSYDEDDEEFMVERDLYVLLRVRGGRIDKIRLFTDDCDVNASGSTIHWIGNVPAGESIALLSGYASLKPSNEDEVDRFQERAVHAIALHNDPSTMDALEGLLEAQSDDELRGNIVFWIGDSDAPGSVAILQRLLIDDPSAHVREQAVFALSQSNRPEAVDALINAARHDDDPEIRSKALFWLSQMAGRRASETLRDAANEDPEYKVKEQAVFALSQLPEEEGIPLLIDVARKNANPKIREHAIFWLGQSEDPRVVDFFEEVLSR